jgi:hypothetical protein
MELYSQYYHGWMAWTQEFNTQAIYLPDDSEDWAVACDQAERCAKYADQVIEAYYHFKAPASACTTISFSLPPEPPPLPPRDDNDDDEFELPDPNEANAPARGLLRYAKRCMAICTTLEQKSATATIMYVCFALTSSKAD